MTNPRFAFVRTMLVGRRFTIPLVVSLAALLITSAARSQSFPPKYLNVLQLAEYSVLSADVNSDTYLDVLVKAKINVVMIDYDVIIPIVLRPSSPTFVLLSNGPGSYTLVVSPAASMVNNPAWQPASHDLVFGDVLGTGSNAMLLRARAAGGPNFLIATSPANGAPMLLQQLTVGNMGRDLSGPNTSTSLLDSNGDGRADLEVNTNGAIVAVFKANSGGLFSVPNGHIPDDRYGYDDLGRLKSVSTGSLVTSYTFDAADNRATVQTISPSSNHAPVCTNTSTTITGIPPQATATLTVTAGAVLALCTDADGDVRTVTAPAVPYSFTIDAGQTRVINFSVSDGRGGVGAGTITYIRP